MAVDITFLRHGETTGNIAGVWQGSTDAPLTPRGRDQAKRVAERLADRPFDLIVSSGMQRTDGTVGMLTDRFEVDPGFAEIRLGEWEGLTPAEVEDRYPGDVAALRRGEPVRPVGGESIAEFVDRIVAAFEALVDRLDDGARVLVSTHGGVIQNLMAHVLGIHPGFRSMGIVANTSLSRISVDEVPVMVTYNDATHLVDGSHEHPHHGHEPHVVLIRHGQSEANVEGRWQGRRESPLSPEGTRQAGRLAHLLPPVDAIFTSPLERARTTAETIAAVRELPVAVVDDLVEMDFGRWEDRTPDEVRREDPAGYRAVYVDGVDAPRGGHGETFAEAAARIGATVADIARRCRRPAVVGHGGAFRAYAADLVGLPFPRRDAMALMRNTAMSTVRFGDAGPVLAGYNVAPHLEG